MRRSAAPSMRNTVKKCVLTENKINEFATATDCSVAKWGTGTLKNESEDKNPLSNKRIFRIVWREKSNKKHKTWTNDGTLVATEGRIVLKDETGKYICSSNAFKVSDLQVNTVLSISNKEFELLDEIKTSEEFWAQHKEQMKNRAWGEEEWTPKETEENKPKGSFIFRPILHLEPLPRQQTMLYYNTTQRNVKRKHSNDDIETKASPQNRKIQPDFTEHFCLLQLSELQEHLFKLYHEYFANQENKESVVLTDADLAELCQEICDHPSLLTKNINQETPLLSTLLNQLTDVDEMGPFDSTKFECLQHLLDRHIVKEQEKCIIIANRLHMIDLLKGYCDFIQINTIVLQRSNNFSECIDAINKFNASNTPIVAIMQPKIELKDLVFNDVQLIIYFNQAPEWTLRENMVSASNLKIFHLITADCCEENEFWQNSRVDEIKNKELSKNYQETSVWSVDKDVLYIPDILGVPKQYKVFRGPFDNNALKQLDLISELSNLKCLVTNK